MSSDSVRIPQQKRSAQKKQAIIQAGYTLFCQQGYYQTNTAQIARAAGVSVGIVYSYFHDKRISSGRLSCSTFLSSSSPFSPSSNP